MFHRGWFHVAVQDSWLRHHVCGLIAGYGTARIASSDEAGSVLSSPARFAGAIAEWSAELDAWIQPLRAASPSLPVLVFVPSSELQRIGDLHARSIEVATQPVHTAQLVAFVQRALASSCLPHDGVARMVAHIAAARGLTAREVQLLSYCLADEPRARIRRRLGITENTLKTQVKALLRKCGERNVDSLAKNVLRAAVLERAPTRSSQEAIAPWYPARGAA